MRLKNFGNLNYNFYPCVYSLGVIFTIILKFTRVFFQCKILRGCKISGDGRISFMEFSFIFSKCLSYICNLKYLKSMLSISSLSSISLFSHIFL